MAAVTTITRLDDCDDDDDDDDHDDDDGDSDGGDGGDDDGGDRFLKKYTGPTLRFLEPEVQYSSEVCPHNRTGNAQTRLEIDKARHPNPMTADYTGHNYIARTYVQLKIDKA